MEAGSGPPPIEIDDNYDPDGNGWNGGAERPINNAFFAIILFLGADLMFFSGLIGSFLVFRFGAEDWPPPGQPRLPFAVTALNTCVLLASGYFMLRTWRSLRSKTANAVVKDLCLTLGCGLAFLLIQGFEWTRLVQFGLKLSSGVFGATFYVLIGCHALHVIGAVVWLAAVLIQLKATADTRLQGDSILRVKLVGMYWFLVVALWPILYGLVYLS